MSQRNIDYEFKEKSLKLLADPCKFKDKKRVIKKQERFKVMLEYKFNIDITTITYTHILQTINDELIISSIVDNIINLIETTHNP
jgi:hypothetical protein